MEYMNAQHYASIKAIADWMEKVVDTNGNYTQIYKLWGEMTLAQKLTEMECLGMVLSEYLANEEDEVWIDNFSSALETVMKIQSELVGGK